MKIDDYTVAFHLEAPNGNFPYLCSSDNYNMIIIPNGYDPTKWQSSFVGTGPWMLKTYTPTVGATFAPNPHYWGTPAKPSEAQFTFYATATASVLALEGGTIDVLGQFAVQGGEALLSGNYNIIALKSSAHRELSMRCDQAPFSDARVRQAVALTLDRTSDRERPVQGKRRPRQRQPVRAGVPFDRSARPACEEHREGEVALERCGPQERLFGQALYRGIP